MDGLPTLEEYKHAKNIVKIYETEQRRITKLNVEAFEIDLKKYFNANLIDNSYKLNEFELRDDELGEGKIIPIDPCMEEDYEGGNNDDIRKICEKHQVRYMFPYWCYPK